MGRIKQGILGGFSGKVGTVVGASWKGKAYMRGMPQHYTQAQNVALQNERSNYQQSQYLLGQMGRWVGWTPEGSQTASGT